jgi:hypothetical protein
MRRGLTMVLPHFQNIGMLAEQAKIWMAYAPDIRARLHVIVVDDCSPEGRIPSWRDVASVSGLASVSLYRLLEKKRWNWLACRNLGAKLATTQWLLMTDIDHALPETTLRRILDGPINPQCAYRFSRVDAPRPWPYRLDECQPYKMHNDTWLLTRELFFFDNGSRFVMGYDERLSGCYGTSGEFRDRVVSCASATVVLHEPMIRYPREVIADASTHPSVYTRKNDPVNHDELQARKKRRAEEPNWRPLHGLVQSEKLWSSLDPVGVAC